MPIAILFRMLFDPISQTFIPHPDIFHTLLSFHIILRTVSILIRSDLERLAVPTRNGSELPSYLAILHPRDE